MTTDKLEGQYAMLLLHLRENEREIARVEAEITRFRRQFFRWLAVLVAICVFWAWILR